MTAGGGSVGWGIVVAFGSQSGLAGTGTGTGFGGTSSALTTAGLDTNTTATAAKPSRPTAIQRSGSFRSVTRHLLGASDFRPPTPMVGGSSAPCRGQVFRYSRITPLSVPTYGAV